MKGVVTIAVKIKGLYFKLNVNKEPDATINKFFEDFKLQGVSKIEVLQMLIESYTKEGCKHE